MAVFNVRNIFGKRDSAPTPMEYTVKNQVLFVCTGNIARSASAELIARHNAADSGWTFVSAGTGALVDHGVAQHLDLLLTAQGVDPTEHRGQQVTEQLIAESALVLVMEREHLNWLVREWPQYRSKVHLLKQVSRLSETAGKRIDPIAYMAMTSDTPRTSDNIADPYRRGPAAAQKAFDEINEALAKVLAWLGSVAPKN